MIYASYYNIMRWLNFNKPLTQLNNHWFSPHMVEVGDMKLSKRAYESELFKNLFIK